MHFLIVRILFILFILNFIISCGLSHRTAQTSISDETVGENNPVLEEPFDSLIWSDEFNDSILDLQKWGYETGTGKDFYPFLNGWGNDELQYYSPDNVTLENGMLVITAYYHEKNIEDKHYTSGKIVTKNKFDFKYGRIEARIKLPYGDVGLWPAFWMMGSNVGKSLDKVGWAECGEIDIMEMGGLKPELIGSAMHYRRWPSNRYQQRLTTVSDQEFHVYRLDWNHREIKAYLDDQLYHTFFIDDKDKKIAFQHNFYLLLNIAIGGRYDKSGHPVPENYTHGISMYIDWIRVYQ